MGRACYRQPYRMEGMGKPYRMELRRLSGCVIGGMEYCRCDFPRTPVWCLETSSTLAGVWTGNTSLCQEIRPSALPFSSPLQTQIFQIHIWNPSQPGCGRTLIPPCHPHILVCSPFPPGHPWLPSGLWKSRSPSVLLDEEKLVGVPRGPTGSAGLSLTQP